MKKLITLFLFISFTFILFLNPKTLSSFSVKFIYNLGEKNFVFNGEEYLLTKNSDLLNGRVIFPLRDLSRVFEIELKWNGEEKSVEFYVGKNKIKLFIGKDYYENNGKRESLLVKPYIYENLTYIALRDFSKILNLKIDWDDSKKSVLISGNFYPIVKAKDDLGNEVTFFEPPKRIVSLAPSNTEILFALGLNSEIIGVTEFCDYPEEAKKKEKIGGFSNPNLEKIYSLEPDFVFGIRGNPKDTLINLTKLNFNVLAYDPLDVDELLNLIELIGKIVDKREEAYNLINKMEEKRNSLINKAKLLPKKRVYLELWNNPYMSVGENSYLNKIIEEMGGINIAKKAKGDWPILSQEFIINENPEVIIIAYMGQNIDEVLKRPGWENIDAVKNKRVYYINPDLLFRLGPRIVDGMEELFNSIHSVSKVDSFSVQGA
ncbi:MAG TPA: helical backbone metal receptor [Caldisericia bacterium]|nr:helical backbone metal receptor [Caldisericia bacterium]